MAVERARRSAKMRAMGTRPTCTCNITNTTLTSSSPSSSSLSTLSFSFSYPAFALLLVALLAATPTHASLGFPRAIKGQGYLSVPVQESRRPFIDDNTQSFHADISRSQQDGEEEEEEEQSGEDSHPVVLTNQEFFYSMTLEFGTPGQPVTVLLDTGSSDLWLNPDCSTAPSVPQVRQCRSFGRYEPANSTTPPTGPFGSKSIRFGDPSNESTRSSVEIKYFSDSVTFGVDEDDEAATLVSQTFGVAANSTGQSYGILGLAPDLDAGFDGDRGAGGALLLDSLVEQGLISRRAFALDLRPAHADRGALVFGGLDRGKFSGALEPLPLVNGTAGEPRLAVNLSSVSVVLPTSDDDASSSSESSTQQHWQLPDSDRNVLLDSGTTLSRLHDPIASSILSALGARSAEDGYYHVAPCRLREAGIASAGVDFVFPLSRDTAASSDSDDNQTTTTTIRVPLSDFILDMGPSSPPNSEGEGVEEEAESEDDDDQDWCYVGLVPTRHQQVLGDSFLRAGYFVFDWDDRVVRVAQAADSCGDHLVALLPPTTAGEEESAATRVSGLCDAAWTPTTASPEEPSSLLSSSSSSSTSSAPAHTTTSCAVSGAASQCTTIILASSPSSASSQSTSPTSNSGDADATSAGEEESSGNSAFAWRDRPSSLVSHLPLILIGVFLASIM